MKSIRLATVALLFLSFGVTGFGLPAVSRTQPPPAEQNTADQEKLFPIVEDNKLGYIDDSGTVVIPPKFHAVTFDDAFGRNRFFEGLAVVRDEEGGWQYIDRFGKSVITLDERFDQAYSFSEGLALVYDYAEGMGFIDRTGRVVIETRLGAAYPFSEGLAAAETEDKWGYIDRRGNWVIPPRFEKAGGFLGGKAVVKEKNQGYSVINRQGQVWARHFEQILLIENGQVIAQPEGGEVSLLDENGATIRTLPFIKSFGWVASEGFISISANGGQGCVDLNFNLVIEPRFNWIGAFQRGLAPARIDEKWGFIDRTGDFVIPPRFTSATCFLDRLALVQFDDENDDSRIGYVNRAGKVVWSTKY